MPGVYIVFFFLCVCVCLRLCCILGDGVLKGFVIAVCGAWCFAR